MRICELHLKAFGPFADRTLDLSDGQAGLHVIFGENEAGKSSTLRALKALLYGFPHSTSDDFRHPSPQLRVGGRLRHSDGTELEIVRKKGRKRTLLGPDETPLPEDALARFLTGVGEQLFQTLFGIDHATLIRGGEDLLQQKGEVGQALFSAGVGAGRLRRLLSQLETDAEALFKARGSNPSINKTLSALDEARRALKEASLPARQWEERRQEREVVGDRLSGIEQTVGALLAERRQLQSLQRALPRFASRRRLQQRLMASGDVIELAPDFAARRQDAERRLESALELQSRALKRLSELEHELEQLVGPKPVLEQAERLDALRESHGSHKKAQADRPRILREEARQLDEARHLLRRVRPDLDLGQVELLRPAWERRARLLKHAQERRRVDERIAEEQEALSRCREALTRLDQCWTETPAPPPSDELRAAWKAAQRAGDLDAEWHELHHQVERERRQLAEALARMPLGPRDLESLARLAAPPAPSVALFEQRELEIRDRSRHETTAREKLTTELAELDVRLGEVEAGGSVPSEDELLAARRERDALWQATRKDGADGEAAERFEAALRAADQLADRLRREADRVHQAASLRVRRERCVTALADADEVAATLQADRDRWADEWRGLWADTGLEPHSPSEMGAWLESRRQVLEKQPRLEDLTGRLRAVADRRRALGARLAELLGEEAPGDPLSLLEWGARAEQRLEEEDQRRRARADLERDLRERKQQETGHTEELARRNADQQRWDLQWDSLRTELALPAELSAEQADELVGDLTRLFDLVDKAATNERRVAGIDDDARRFEQEVQAFARQVAADLAELPVEVILGRLKTQLEEARRRETLREKNGLQIREQRQELNNAESTVETIQARIASLRTEARCGDEDDLEAIERHSAERRELRLELERLEQLLLEDGDGADLEELERRATGVTPAALEERLVRIGRELEQAEAQRNDLYTQLGVLQAELDRMDGSARSAELAERWQALVATLDTGVRQYIRLRLAAALLRREIDRYRQENQAPVLRRAEGLFVHLTRGSFQRLVEDVDDKERPILVGVRDSGERVPVAGMSEGTCDQLYLALRLATLEQHLERVEPMPFIVDDILINFDDERSRATLEVLAELSKRTQVILFTHHRRVFETARELSGEHDIWLHALGEASSLNLER